MSSIPPKISSRFNKDEIFLIKDEATFQKIILVAYPHWEAYSSYIENDIWVRVTPTIDIRKQCIIVLESLDRDAELNNKTEKKRSAKKVPMEIKIPPNFINSIPEDLRKRVEEFNDSHWEMISAALILGDDFINLLKINPPLAYLIVNLEIINGTIRIYNERARLNRLIRTKQKEILSLAFLPSTGHMKKLFSKIDLKFLSRNRLLNICRFFYLQQDKSKIINKLLSHLKSINEQLIILLSYHHELIVLLSPKIIEELIVSERFNEQVTTIENIRIRSAEVEVKFPVIDDLNRLDQIDSINKERVAFEKKAKEFPDPPYEGTKTIIPLRTEKEQISWSKAQRNCLRNLADRVLKKNSFFYRVDYEGEQATLELIRRNGKYDINQISGYKNKSVSSALSEHARNWLNENWELETAKKILNKN
ncbi:MAG: hypothetical protein M5R37_01460 [Melioribacteraceae bacterium]|nr:hypothetical protein [Melioribacteraceae bacterium]